LIVSEKLFDNEKKIDKGFPGFVVDQEGFKGDGLSSESFEKNLHSTS